MVKVEVGEEDDVHVGWLDARLPQAIEEATAPVDTVHRGNRDGSVAEAKVDDHLLLARLDKEATKAENELAILIEKLPMSRPQNVV